MKRYLIILIAVIILFLAFTPDGVSKSGSALRDYMDRHQARMGLFSDIPDELPYFSSKGYDPGLTLFDDVAVNDDNGPARFKQQYPAGVLKNAGLVFLMWEDERNGDLDIFGQNINYFGNLDGSNKLVISDDNYLDQFMAAFAVSSDDEIAAVWVDEAGDLYLRFYNNIMLPQSDPILVNDNIFDNIVSFPDLAFLSDGRLVVVWEDTRSGSAVFGQIYDDLYNPVGDNFRITPDEAGKLFWSPHVAAGANGQFAVVWEEIGSMGANVLMLLFDSDAQPSGISINVADIDHQADDQFDADIAGLSTDSYVVGWTDSRDDEQKIFLQRFDANANLLGSNQAISSAGAFASDLRLFKTPANNALAVWASIENFSEILGQEIDINGPAGDNFMISDPLVSGERREPYAVFRDDGSAEVVFTDTRNGISDIFKQSLDDQLDRKGSNMQVSQAESGAQQIEPVVARMEDDDMAVVWTDMRDDAGDIYFQRLNYLGLSEGSNLKINDDAGKTFQGDPSMGSADNGKLVISWVDSRTTAQVFGVNVFAQLIDPLGNRTGANFLVNDFSISEAAVHAEPDCDIAPSGKVVVAWRDTRNGGNDIYCQVYNADGSPDGSNFKVNDEDFNCFDPSISIFNNEMFVVGWRMIVDNRSYVKYQVFDSDAGSFGSELLLPIDTATHEQLDFDLAVNPYYGIFSIAWLDQTDTVNEIHGVMLDINGSALSTVKIVSDMPNLGFEDISVDMDALNSYVVGWSDMRDGVRRAYRGFVDAGTTVLANQPLWTAPDPARHEHPSVATNGRYVFSVWSDNRNAGEGFDIFASSNLYNPTSVDGDGDNATLPRDFVLSQNYPNPFNPTTMIEFSLTNDVDRAQFEVYNLLGRKVYQKDLENLPAGKHVIEFDGAEFASGVYLYRLKVGDASIARKMTLIK